MTEKPDLDELARLHDWVASTLPWDTDGVAIYIDSTWRACLSCGGAGSVLRQDVWGNWVAIVCLACNGTGKAR